MYFTQAGKATLWTTKREPRISVCLLPTSYLRCKTSRSDFTEARCSWPAAPFKISFPSALSKSFSLFLSIMLFSALSNLDSFLYSNRGHVLRSLLLFSLLYLCLSLSLECHSSWKASALHSSVSYLPPIYKKKKTSTFWWQDQLRHWPFVWRLLQYFVVTFSLNNRAFAHFLMYFG